MMEYRGGGSTFFTSSPWKVRLVVLAAGVLVSGALQVGAGGSPLCGCSRPCSSGAATLLLQQGAAAQERRQLAASACPPNKPCACNCKCNPGVIPAPVVAPPPPVVTFPPSPFTTMAPPPPP